MNYDDLMSTPNSIVAGEELIIIERLKKENEELKLKVKQLTNENTNLRLGDKEELQRLRGVVNDLTSKLQLAKYNGLGSIGGLNNG